MIQPRGDLVLDTAGNIYGTTKGGGTNGHGAIYRYTPGPTVAAGTATNLASFNFSTTGFQPDGLVRDSSGNLYGDTLDGGANGGGTLFKYNTTDGLTVPFNYPANSHPENNLLLASDGNLYGEVNSPGSLFQHTLPGNAHTVLTGTPGLAPSNLIEGSDGNFYGTIETGGTGNLGAIFKYVPSGPGAGISTLFSFTGANGSDPASGTRARHSRKFIWHNRIGRSF